MAGAGCAFIREVWLAGHFTDWMKRRSEREKIIGPWFRHARDRHASSPRQQELFRLSSDGSGVLD
jgi:hypothetical protein